MRISLQFVVQGGAGTGVPATVTEIPQFESLPRQQPAPIRNRKGAND